MGSSHHGEGTSARVKDSFYSIAARMAAGFSSWAGRTKESTLLVLKKKKSSEDMRWDGAFSGLRGTRLLRFFQTPGGVGARLRCEIGRFSAVTASAHCLEYQRVCVVSVGYQEISFNEPLDAPLVNGSLCIHSPLCLN